MSKIRIVHLYQKELNLYGDSGNVLCLQKRLEWRHYGCEVVPVGVGEPLPAFDILFIGGGQDKEMALVAKDVRRRAEALRYAIESGKAVLAICGGYQLLGESYRTADGSVLKLSGALPFYTVGGDRRMIGNTVFDTVFGRTVGFENHSGKTFLSGGLKPLGQVVKGYGNNGQDGGEGLLFCNTFGTYAHGPVLPKNPRLADEILRRALGSALPPLDDTAENRCHNELVARFSPLRGKR